MKIGAMRKLIIGLLIVSTAGCVGLRTREEVSEMENSKQAQTQVSTLQKQKAEADNKVLVLQDELRQLNGRLDMLERKAQEQGGGNGPSNADVIEQMKIFEQQNAAMKAKIEELETKLATAQKTQAANAVAAVEKSTPAPKERDKDGYEAAEDLFNKKEWKSAILSYQSYRDANPKGKHYADSTYKIGVSFQELKMKDEAKVFFEEVVQKYPKSPAARKAKFRLGQIK